MVLAKELEFMMVIKEFIFWAFIIQWNILENNFQ